MKKILLSILTIATLQAGAQLPANEFLRYEFTQGSSANTAATTAADLTGNFTSIADRNGNFGDAASISTVVNGANIGATNLNNSTLSFWIKRSALSSNERVIQLYGIGSRGYRIELDGTSLYINGSVESSTANTGGFFSYSIPVGLDDNSWHHVAIRTKGVNANTSIQVELFVDGVQVMISGQFQQYWTPGGTINNFLQHATLRIDPLNGQYGGDIDDIYLYKDDLTNAEITQLYNYTVPPSPTRYYVDVDATGTNDGTSWANAFTDLEDACLSLSDNMEMWVAEGTYSHDPINSNRDATYTWDNDSIKIYGGFNGTETSLSQRNWRAHETIISGDIGLIGDESDNCYTVFGGPKGSSSNTINYALIDGLIIQDGNCNGSGPAARSTGGGFYSFEYVVETDIKNCTFRNNIGTNASATAVYAYNTSKTVNFENCTFKDNISEALASGLILRAPSGLPVTSKITNCLFINNTTKSLGVGNIKCSVFYFGSTGTLADISVDIINSTITGNNNTDTTPDLVGLFLLYASSGASTNTINIKNTIIYGNSGNDGIFKRHTSGVDFTSIDHLNSICDLTTPLTFYTATNVLTSNPNFTNVASGDFTLQSGSPAIDAGDATGLVLPSLDLAGNARIVGSDIDMGCYESPINVGVDENTNNNKLTAYPNPTNGLVTFSSNDQIKSIVIYNLTGKSVATFSNTNNIDISNLTNGVYFAKIITESSKPVMQKLIKR